MKNKLSILFIILFVSFLNAQEEILKIENPLKESNFDVKQSLAVYDEISNNLSVLLEDKKIFMVIYLMETFKKLLRLNRIPYPISTNHI